MPPKTQYPIPSLRFHNGAWKIVWNWDGKQYSVSTGVPEKDKLFADKHRIEFEIALKKDIPSFPAEYKRAKSVIKYTEKRYGVDSADQAAGGTERWVIDYKHEISGKNTDGWIRDSIRLLEKLQDSAKGLENVTEKIAAACMADIAFRRTPGTHNRNLTVYKKFYSWLINTRRHNLNPFKKIKRINERKDTQIVYCTQAERDEIIQLAKDAGWPEWLAVPIAFYAGMRREEIANLRWESVRMTGGQIVVAKTKTGVSRTLPLNSTLLAYFEAIPNTQRSGYVVEVSEEENRVWRLNSLARKIRKLKRDQLLAEWNMPRPQQSKAKEYKERRLAWERAKKTKDAEIDAALERIGWNAFRHTFGSLLAQSGVSIDKISAWMGNTPEVCRRHYAQFIPRDKRDSEIDNL